MTVDITMVQETQDMVYGIINNLYVVLSSRIPDSASNSRIPHIKFAMIKVDLDLILFMIKGETPLAL